MEALPSDTRISCHVLCGGVPVDKSTFANYERLLVVWPTRKAYTMDGWSDNLVRSGMVPLIAESQFDNENEWCLSRGLVKAVTAEDHKEEIEPYLPAATRNGPVDQSLAEGIALRYSSTRFSINSNLRSDISWFFPYIEDVYDQLRTKLGHEPIQYLPIRCVIRQGQPGGIGGWTALGEMGVEAGDFAMNRWCLVISAQELVNLFTGSISAGWPVDWWANHKSPFPIMVAVEVVRDLGYVQEANEYDREFESDPLYVWHRSVRRRHGWNLYRKMFSAMKADGIQLSRIGPNPGKLLTNYVLAYMSIGSETLDLHDTARVIPNADERMVRNIVNARRRIELYPRNHKMWVEYLSGTLFSV